MKSKNISILVFICCVIFYFSWMGYSVYLAYQEKADKTAKGISSARGLSPDAVGISSYWITSSSGKRHNEHCRWYETSKGYYGLKDDGEVCKVCGG